MSTPLALAWLTILFLAVTGAWRVLDILLDAHLRGRERLARARARGEI
jgi:hypothetical protein